MKVSIFLTIASVLILCSTAFAAGPDNAAAGSADACKASLAEADPKNMTFAIADLDAVATGVVEEGPVIKKNIPVRDGRRIVSKIDQGPMAFFAANMALMFPPLDANKTQEYSNSTAIRFLREYGLVEMMMLGPDLSKPNPFLDMVSPAVESPSAGRVDQTNVSLKQLTDRMHELLSPDQQTALQNALKGNFAKSIKQVEGVVRLVLAKFAVSNNVFSSFVSDKQFLKQIQEMLWENWQQFEKDIVYIDELQARYRKTREALKTLADQGEMILNLRAAALAGITHEGTKVQVGKDFDRFAQRVTDLTAGVAVADTFINMWQVIKDNHFELIAGIQRTLYFTVPIIGAQMEIQNALNRQARTREAITSADNARDQMIQNLNRQMQTAVEQAHKHDVAAIKADADNLGELLIGTILVQQAMDEHAREKVTLLEAARAKYRDISARAIEQRQRSGLDAPPAGPETQLQ